MDPMGKWESGQFTRRRFLLGGAVLAAGSSLPLVSGYSENETKNGISGIPGSATQTAPVNTSNAKVAIVRCKSYGTEVKDAYRQCFDLLGGIGSLVKNKTVTVKINLTGSPFEEIFGRVSGESYLTHGATAIALAQVFLDEGAKRVRFVESASFRESMEDILSQAGWDVRDLKGLNNVELENTRNKGTAWSYSTVSVSTGGYLFSSFDLNHSYVDTDVFVSLAKLKNHEIAGITLAMKNCFGITPNAIYGDDAGSEEAIKGRSRFHGGWGRWRRRNVEPLPGQKEGDFPNDDGFRVPRIITDLCAARPIHLSIIDGITAMSGGEGYWSRGIHFTQPGVLIAGLNPVSTDAVGMAVMGYSNPRAERGTPPFRRGDNHILLAEQSGLGTADLSYIDVRGLTIQEALYPYERMNG